MVESFNFSTYKKKHRSVGEWLARGHERGNLCEHDRQCYNHTEDHWWLPLIWTWERINTADWDTQQRTAVSSASLKIHTQQSGFLHPSTLGQDRAHDERLRDFLDTSTDYAEYVQRTRSLGNILLDIDSWPAKQMLTARGHTAGSWINSLRPHTAPPSYYRNWIENHTTDLKHRVTAIFNAFRLSPHIYTRQSK